MIIQKNRPGDETFLARLNGANLEKLEDWTSDTKKLLVALQRPYKPDGNTALFSAMWVCLDHVARRSAKENSSKYRQALVLITDGLEINSKHTFRELIKKLQSQNVQIFTLGFVTRPRATDFSQVDDNKTANENLNIIAKETGGLAFLHFAGDDFKKPVELVAESLRSQYVVGYRSSLTPDKDSFRKIKITVSDGQNRSVYARSGYWPKIYKPQGQ